MVFGFNTLNFAASAAISPMIDTTLVSSAGGAPLDPLLSDVDEELVSDSESDMAAAHASSAQTFFAAAVVISFFSSSSDSDSESQTRKSSSPSGAERI